MRGIEQPISRSHMGRELRRALDSDPDAPRAAADDEDPLAAGHDAHVSGSIAALYARLDPPLPAFTPAALGDEPAAELAATRELWLRCGYRPGIAAYLCFFLLRDFLVLHDERFPPRFATWRAMARSFHETDRFVRAVTDSGREPSGGIAAAPVRDLLLSIMARHRALDIPGWMMSWFGWCLIENVERECAPLDEPVRRRHHAYLCRAFRLMGVAFAADRERMVEFARAVEREHTGAAPQLERRARAILLIGEMVGVRSRPDVILAMLPEAPRARFAPIAARVRPGPLRRTAARVVGRLLVPRAVGVRRAARALLLLAAALLPCPVAAAQQQRWPVGHPDHGLPRPGVVWAPYDRDPDHVCNGIFRAIHLTRCVPAEVARALPREHGDARDLFVPGWYFGKRDGRPADERWFGGDGRQVPVEGFDEAAAARLRADLAAVDGAVAAELRARPRAAVWFQHDLLRMLRRLIDTGRNPELVPLLWECALRVALRRETLERPELLQTVTLEQIAAAVAGFDPRAAVEIERRSTRLFDAEFVQVWSSIWIQFPADHEQGVAAWLARRGHGGAAPVPIGALAVLVQGVVAVDAAGSPHATDLVTEVRTQRLVNRNPLSADNATTTRDGVDLAVWSLPRAAVCREEHGVEGFAAFRTVHMESQELFRDYGTLKHTTYAAQCALCHRRAHASDEALAGFSALRPGAGARPVADPRERRRRAEAEMERFVARLRER